MIHLLVQLCKLFFVENIHNKNGIKESLQYYDNNTKMSTSNEDIISLNTPKQCNFEGCDHTDIRYTPMALISIHHPKIYSLMNKIYDHSAELYGYGEKSGLIWKEFENAFFGLDITDFTKYNIIPYGWDNTPIDYSCDPSLLALQSSHDSECELRKTELEYTLLIEQLKERIQNQLKPRENNQDYLVLMIFVFLLYLIVTHIITYYS